jgi:hypothetical protein
MCHLPPFHLGYVACKSLRTCATDASPSLPSAWAPRPWRAFWPLVGAVPRVKTNNRLMPDRAAVLAKAAVDQKMARALAAPVAPADALLTAVPGAVTLEPPAQAALVAMLARAVPTPAALLVAPAAPAVRRSTWCSRAAVAPHHSASRYRPKACAPPDPTTAAMVALVAARHPEAAASSIPARHHRPTAAIPNPLAASPQETIHAV